MHYRNGVCVSELSCRLNKIIHANNLKRAWLAESAR